MKKTPNSRIFGSILETETHKQKTGVLPSFKSPIASHACRGKEGTGAGITPCRFFG